MGWTGKVRVNGTTYKWMGQDGAGTPANVTNIQATPTRTIFVVQAGPMNVTITFLSPVEPDDWVKQSIPFSYMSVEVQSLDGNSYPVQLYSDISAEWASGNRSGVVQWGNTNTGNSIYHKIQLQGHPQTVEIENQAQDGTVYYAMSTSQSGISWQIDRNDTVRDGFQSNGKLTNTASNEFVAISPAVSIFALAVDLGTIQSTASPITWSVGYVRDPAITYTAPDGAVQLRRPYYIDAFTGDYAGAYSRAVALDQKIMSAATRISSQYSDIVALATRQVMATLDFTVGTDSNNNVVPGDVKIFMKNMGTDNRVNPVEHIYAAFPMFLYLNASIGGALLEPLLEVQASLTGQSFAAMDIGNAYPTAPGSEAVAQQGVEQSGNMLIMELAYARISGDGAFLSRYYNTTKRWADYLVSNALQSSNQTNLDGDTTDLANTALKGIIGVKAMAEIAHALGEDSDATEYSNQSSSLFNSWLSLATSSSGSRLLGGYGNQQSWSLMYNLFADKMLGLNFVPQSVIDMQTQYLNSLLATEASQWGFPVDSESQQNGNTAWTLFASAFVSDTTLRDALIERIHNHANSNVSLGLFAEIYSISDNSYQRGAAGPALGGAFSHLALTVPNKTISLVSATGSTPQGGVPARSSSKVGPIVGGVIGGLAIACIVIAIVVVILRKKRRLKYKDADTTEVQPHRTTLSPYYQNPSSDYMHVPVRSSNTTAGFAGIGVGSMGAYKSAAISLPPDSSAKAQREARRLGREMQQLAPSDSEQAATSSNVGSQTGSAWTTDVLSPRGSISTTDVVGLRMEVENLRQVMRDIRAERLESPPEYAE
ncbi:hypothetical protein GSI_01549 [Ganoderma sinense ZZ0214-1]|uniref:DUF1793-domain-containing protein n=1 Tax=Ganoderma sinense ZZ0214-1 TaxID=1077348 RepID=A0A2G8SQ43_9APHY|nr:hypothetical protein GSI_01549 [Ganoderma sinense ZZ0214-1]